MAWSLLVHLRSYRVAQTPVSNSCRSISDEAAEALPNPSSSPEIFSSFPCLSRLVQCYLGLLLRSQFLSPLLHSHASLLLPVRTISNTLRVIKVFWMPSDVSIGRETWSTWSIPVRITLVYFLLILFDRQRSALSVKCVTIESTNDLSIALSMTETSKKFIFTVSNREVTNLDFSTF